MIQTLCFHCTLQIKEKAATKAETEEHEKLFAVACSHASNMLLQDIQNHNHYPMFQVVNNGNTQIVCFGHWMDPDTNVPLFDEWIEEVYR